MTASNFTSRRADTIQPGDTIHIGTCVHIVTHVGHTSPTTVTVDAGEASWQYPASHLINTERTPG